MRILEINKFYNAKRGADKHFLSIIKLLTENGQEVAAFAMDQKDNESSQWNEYFVSSVGYSEKFSSWEKIKGVFRMFYSLEAHKKINLLLDKFKPELVHIHNIYHQLDPTILFAIKKREIPIVMTVHDYKLVNPNHSLFLKGKAYTGCKDKKYYQCFLDKCVKDSYAKSFLTMLEAYWHDLLGTYRKNIDLYLVPSEYVKKILIQWGIPCDKIKVFPHFIATEEGEAISEKKHEEYAFYAGKISHEKGIETLLKIFENMPDKKLYLAGEIAQNFILPQIPNIKYVGILKEKELGEYMRNAKFVVSPSELPETFGLIALEAIALGKPFIGFDTGAYGEIIKNGLNGFLAKSKPEFIHLIKTAFSEDCNFNEEEIALQAREKYGKIAYYESIMHIFYSLTK